MLALVTNWYDIRIQSEDHRDMPFLRLPDIIKLTVTIRFNSKITDLLLHEPARHSFIFLVPDGSKYLNAFPSDYIFFNRISYFHSSFFSYLLLLI